MAADLNTRWRKPDAVWLMLALGVHALVLLLPLHQAELPQTTLPVVTVELTPWPRATVIDPAELLVLPAGLPETGLEYVSVPAISRPTPEKPPGNSESGATPTEEKIADTVTTARLVHMARHSTLDVQPPPSTRRLGSRTTGALSPGWRPADNLFDGMMAPPRTEIVDRWLAADGSHNVVVNLPSGETLCGRAEAWNPMQALVEHVMMFRGCGGGGKRTFEMASREMPDRGNPE